VCAGSMGIFIVRSTFPFRDTYVPSPEPEKPEP
jgi:hypothetical protein